MTNSKQVKDHQINLIGEHSEITGTLNVTQTTRISGTIKGKVIGAPGSEIIVSESAMIEGNIIGDVIIVEGYVNGNIYATTRMHLKSCGRVRGNIFSAQFRIDFGAYFEGVSKMESLPTPESLFDQTV